NKLKSENVTKLTVDEFENIPGKGIKASINGEYYYVGNDLLMNEYGVKGNISHLANVKRLSEQAKTVVFFSDSKEILYLIGISDKIKDSSKTAITELTKMGIEIVMITGDNKHTASVIAKEAGINNFVAEVL